MVEKQSLKKKVPEEPEDFLRQRGLPMWGKDAPQAREVRATGLKNPTRPIRQMLKPTHAG